MDRDTEQLNLLAIFHYVVAGLAALFSLFPLLYTSVGVIFIFAARHGTAKPGDELPPEFLGWIFAVLGFVRNGNSNGDFYSHRRPIARAPQALFLSVRHSLHRMSLRSVRNDSRSVYNCGPFARDGEDVVFVSTDARVKPAHRVETARCAVRTPRGASLPF
jgi:hypothetical protein